MPAGNKDDSVILASKSWDASSAQSWAEILGLVPVPLFGAQDRHMLPGKHAILLDGQRGSFIFSAIDEFKLAQSDEPISWAWSADVRHALIVNSEERMMFLRRWDTPGTIRRFRLPERGQTAVEVFQEIERSPAPRSQDVVRHVLSVFRLLRQSLYDVEESVHAVRLLNGFLLLSLRVHQGQLQRKKLLEAQTIRQVVENLTHEQRRRVGLDDLPPEVAGKEVGLLLHPLLEPEPRTGCVLNPGLLLRHAASRLYQEAHLMLERDPLPMFAGMGSIDEPVGELPRDARFTPPNMARALAQRSITAFIREAPAPRSIVVLDPACGSGSFLLECLRELLQQKVPGELRLVGYDKSDIAVAISRFCLDTAKEDAKGTGLKIDVEVQQKDALAEPWEAADMVLMNPPFVPFDALGDSQGAVIRILGAAATGRVDMAMAFILKGVGYLRDHGVLASVMPVPLLANESGNRWREELARLTDMLLLGRFEGYGYFPPSAVEIAFILLKKKDSSRQRPPVQVVIAKEGSEDAALRMLRLSAVNGLMPASSVEVFSVGPGMMNPSSWLPQRKSVYELRDFLVKRGLPSVGDLFTVHQGALTGDNLAFVISVSEWDALPVKEKAFFRPTAGQGTIRDGRLICGEYVFYPYDSKGPRIADEAQLKREVPQFLERKLKPRESHLKRRARVASQWWLLSEERSWQLEPEPKIVTNYFGLPGSFSYDSAGDYVAVQGYAWLWKKRVAPKSGGNLQSEVHQTPLPWAYVALLNSTVFGRMLACYCPRVQGGQFNLSRRFVKNVPVPDLGTAEAFATGLVDELASFGRQILQDGAEAVRAELDKVVTRAYGLPASLMSEPSD